jgi:AcrR family transcriptional regulator
VSINYLIFDGFSRKAEISGAEIDLLKQRENLLQLEYDLRARLRGILLSINSLKTQIKAVQSSLEFAKEGLRLSTERYRLGVGSQLELLEARANYNNLLANYYLLLYQYKLLLSRLGKADPMSSARERLLESAKTLFSQKGYYATSVEDIVASAGLSKGAFYFYFKSKEELFKSLVEEMHLNIVKRLENFLERELPLEDALIEHAKVFLEDIYQNRHIAQIFLFQLVGTNEEFRELYYTKIAHLRELLTKMVDRAIQRGEITYKNAENIVNLYAGFLRMLVLEYVFREREPDLERVKSLAQEGVKVLFMGLKNA